jgi:hypothetical protein
MGSNLNHAIDAPRTLIVTLAVINEAPQMKVTDLLPATTGGTPPRAPLAFRVGVVGHRPNRLKEANLKQLAESISTILSAVKDETLSVARDCKAHDCKALYDGAGPVLRAISPLAEGTDRIFAQKALDLGFKLCCVLPFPQAEFEKDFASGTALEEGDSLTHFRGLLAQATTRFELDGNRSEESEAYGAGGRVVLNQSDLLIVVWDGQRLGKRGGTEETFDEARSRGVTVVWIDAQVPHPWQLLDAATPLPRVPDGERVVPKDTGSADALRKWVREALELPAPPQESTGKAHAKGRDPRQALEQFYAEHRPRWTLAVFWKLFQQAVGDGKLPKVKFSLEDFEEGVRREWPKDRSTPIAQLVDTLRPFYAWPDKLAVLYADRYRSAFLLAFLIAATAVGLALLPVAAGITAPNGLEIACVFVEFVAIVTILGLIIQGQRRHWHERWLDYRLTAELVRHLRLVAPLGGRRPFPQVPAHWTTYGQPGASWMAWYVRAIERALGLPSAVVDRAYLDGNLAHLADLVQGQIDYHENNARRCHNMEKWLHYCGLTFFWLTLAACGSHLWLSIKNDPLGSEWLPRVLTFLCGFFPALGAAMAGILTQGEFRRITSRSKAMLGQLQRQLKEIEGLREQTKSTPSSIMPQYSTQAVTLASTTANLLVNEVLDWRVVLLDQPLRPPA